MFKFLASIASLAVVMGLAASVQAKVVHVSPQVLAGVAAEDQVRTIAEAARGVTAGDRVVVHGGTYREAVVVDASGSSEKPIVFEAAPGEHVIVTGADLITDWRREDDRQQIYSTPWPHQFIGGSRTHAHPDDDHHLLIGRCEQVFAGHYLMRQVLARAQLSRGTFFADLEGQRLYVWTADNADLSKHKVPIEASVRQVIWQNNGAFIHLRGLRFRYSACMAQHGMVQIKGDHNVLADCVAEYANGVGISLIGGRNAELRRCVIQFNGQLGLGASGAHDLLLSGCTVRGNGTKDWDRGWEAGSIKICSSRGVVIEQGRFLENRGNGIWFDIGNEDPTVRNCLIADNEDAGLFCEISYGLHALDNVIVGNGFDADGGAWGAAAGIALSSSPGCRIERNLLVGNKEGFNYREQPRTTPRIGSRGQGEVAIWNHDEFVRNNVIAYNRDAQCWGWFDTQDGRHWPQAMQAGMTKKAGRPRQDIAGAYAAKGPQGQPTGLTLEQLKLDHGDNLYYAGAGQGVFNWGSAWGSHRIYATLQEAQQELNLETGSTVAEPGFADVLTRDFRVPRDSPALRMKAYPRGEVPDVRLGVLE